MNRQTLFSLRLAAAIAVAIFCLLVSMPNVHADAVVTDGRFTNVYIVQLKPGESGWDDHLRNLAANLKPSDWQRFTRESIDAFTQSLMSTSWPSYFASLHQYGGINPPQFFGSFEASADCVSQAIHDENKGVIETTTIRSLANCHQAGMDPSPQVNLIFAPDLKVGAAPSTPLGASNGPDICSMPGTHPVAYHYWGLNVPNFAVLPTAPGCAGNFDEFTVSFSHEDVEMISDPGQVGHGGAGGSELADQCEGQDITWNGFQVQRYRSDDDNDCWPLPFPGGSSTITWILAEGSPVVRYTGSVHTHTFNVPASRPDTTAAATEVQLWIQTGGDDLRSDSAADAVLKFAGGNMPANNISAGHHWDNNQTHIAVLNLPAAGVRVSDIQNVVINTNFGGGISGDNWNVDKVALVIGVPAGSTITQPPQTIVHTWLDRSGGPLIRMTGSVHDLDLPVAAQDQGLTVTALNLIISTGNDDLRGGSGAGDNCKVQVFTTLSPNPIVINNANDDQNWKNWTDHTVPIPIPAGFQGGDVTHIEIHTGFGGGISGDNWNIQRVQLQATVQETRLGNAAP